MKKETTNHKHQKKTGLDARSVRGVNILKGLTLMLVVNLIAIGCDSIVDQNAEVDISISTGEVAGAFSMVEGSELSCINPDAGVYNKVMDSNTVEWGNPRNPFEKTVEIEYYNTLSEFMLRVKSTKVIADVLVNGESIKEFDGKVEAGIWQEFMFELEEAWKAGDKQSFSLEVAGSGPPISFDIDYALVGACITVCGDPVTFMYDGSEVTYGTLTGANGSCWHDRNLGAAQVATSSTDAQSYGDYFTFDEAVNACPIGFQLATEAEWEAERLSWISNNAAGAFASQLKLPMAGYRSSGSQIGVGSAGVLWSGTVSGEYARTLYFGSSDAYMFSGGQFVRRSVRCLKEDT
tara:strand:+ start:18268 stop:19314 length:1047 start_codon:yes stop_codon:yes gene_type:complete